ncbi:helix-turn-helix domain-containing protein [Catellatospora tritici]|uniref:helix-turn-helix domain-containing protein n=1 Tax=Catellatospora tritici TaxID=2851566 RepID=UPI001C2DA178|nr:MerR family transcriptional regulator [Catellatospora tritici]MBV1856498.1 MerR family transcriptional regulator [Catellatospora tritici]
MTHPPVPTAAQWTVAEFAVRSGVPATTLRYWDAEGLLVPGRLVNGHRRYQPADLDRAEMIRMCQALGASVEEIMLILDAPDPGQRARYAAGKLPEVIEKIALLRTAEALLRHLAVCGHGDAESCRAWMRAHLP